MEWGKKTLFDFLLFKFWFRFQSFLIHCIHCIKFSVFTSHAKTKFVTTQWIKNLGYDRWWMNKQPRQESGLCCFSFARYLQKYVTQIYRALYEDAMFVSFRGTQTWRTLSNRNIFRWVLLLKRNIIALELRHIERNVSSSASTVQLAKTKVITHLWAYTTAFSGRNVHVTQRKSLEIQTCTITIRKTLSSWNIVKHQVPVGSFIGWN